MWFNVPIEKVPIINKLMNFFKNIYMHTLKLKNRIYTNYRSEIYAR